MRALTLGLTCGALLSTALAAAWANDPPPAATSPMSQPPATDVPDVLVQAQEPRFVAPTRRDKIGRIWAPVTIDGQGPFRLVLDTGATASAITPAVATRLGLAVDPTRIVMLRGVSGTEVVPTVTVDSFLVGDLLFTPASLPILTDPLGGAEGVLGTDGFENKRVFIDFRHDRITIANSHGERAGYGFVTVPFERSEPGLLLFNASVNGVRVRAILDTGGQRTIGNVAMRNALYRKSLHGENFQIFDVTDEQRVGEMLSTPPIKLGSLELQGARVTYADMPIFQHWNLIDRPALLIGMDVIGFLDTVVIDYRRRELQLSLRSNGGSGDTPMAR